MTDSGDKNIAEIPGLPDKWKLIHCSATNPANLDHPLGKWRDADILNLLREIANLSDDNQRLKKLQDLRSHKWTGRRMGGNPANVESYEWVRFCDYCGAEDTCEDVPACEVTREYLFTENQRLRAENARYEEIVASLEQKYADCPHPKPLDSYGEVMECGCSYDRPSDICFAHAPLIKKLQAENARLKQQAADDKLAFDHANEVVGKLEADLRRNSDAHLLRSHEALREALKGYRDKHMPRGATMQCATDPLWPEFICPLCKQADAALTEAAALEPPFNEVDELKQALKILLASCIGNSGLLKAPTVAAERLARAALEPQKDAQWYCFRCNKMVNTGHIDVICDNSAQTGECGEPQKENG